MDRPGSRALITQLTALVALGPVSVSLYVPSMPALAAEFQVTPGLVQQSFTIFVVGFAVAQLVYGPMSDRFGRRPVLVGGLMLYIAASLACALSASIDEFLAARLAQGLGACVGPVVVRAIVRDRFERADAVRAFAFIGTAIAVAPAVGPLIGGFLEVWFGWRSAFLFLVGYGVLMTGLVLFRLEETVPERDPGATDPARLIRNYAGLLSNARYLGYLAPVTFCFGGLFAYNATAPFLIIDRLGLSPDRFGMLAIFTVSTYATGSWLAGRLEGRLSTRRTITAGLAAAGLATALMLLLAGELSLARVIGPMMLFVFGFGLLIPACTAAALQPFPRIAGSASAMMGFLQMGVGAVGSLILSKIYDGTAASLGLVMAMMAALGAAGFLLLAPGRAAEDAAAGEG
ncbi:MAG: multidrug effflux MFS transporter [Alphaproteobacteria bacterium]|nr:multidrug effflux MFS transporter [Alphaproteobacteria bacterium]